MFGLGPTEIILMLIVIVLLLLSSFVAIVAIVVSVLKYYTGNREAKLEARIEQLEKRLGEQQQK